METRDAGQGQGQGARGAGWAAPAPAPDPWAGTPVADDRLWPAEALAARFGRRLPERLEINAAAERGIPFGALFRLTRVRAGLTQADAAALLGLAANTVARWERGEFEPPRRADLPICREAALQAIGQQLDCAAGARSPRRRKSPLVAEKSSGYSPKMETDAITGRKPRNYRTLRPSALA